MCSAYVWPRLVQGQGKKLTLFPMFYMGYSSPSVIALVYDFSFFFKKVWFHPVTYGGRHDCFRFRKHPSSEKWFWVLLLSAQNSTNVNILVFKVLVMHAPFPKHTQHMNSFNKTEAAVFSCRLCFLRAFPFISLTIHFVIWKRSSYQFYNEIQTKNVVRWILM